MPKIVNLTPHALNIHKTDGTVETIPASGTVARLPEKRKDVAVIGGVQISAVNRGDVIFLPSPQSDTMFVVSALVAEKVQRSDVYSPGPLVRDPDTGQPIGCQGLTSSLPLFFFDKETKRP